MEKQPLVWYDNTALGLLHTKGADGSNDWKKKG